MWCGEVRTVDSEHSLPGSGGEFLLVTAWTLMKKKELFDPKYLNEGDTTV